MYGFLNFCRKEEEVVKEEGTVYAIRNPLFRMYVKIGITSDTMKKRLFSLNTSVPKDFEIIDTVRVKNYKTVEKLLHTLFKEYRYNESREFFIVSDDKIKEHFSYIRELAGIEENISLTRIKVNSKSVIETDKHEHITRGQLVEFIKEEHDKNPGILRKYIGLNSSKVSARNKNFGKIKIYPIPKLAGNGRTMTVAIEKDINVYVNYSSFDISQAYRQYQLLFLRGELE